MYNLSKDKAINAYISGMIQFLMERTPASMIRNTTPFRTLDYQVEVWPKWYGTGMAGTTWYHVTKRGEGYVLVTNKTDELYRYLVNYIRAVYGFRYTIERCQLMSDHQTEPWVAHDIFLYTGSIEGAWETWHGLEITPTRAYRLIDWINDKPRVFGVMDDHNVLLHNNVDISVS